jgi:hypothetical protein
VIPAFRTLNSTTLDLAVSFSEQRWNSSDIVISLEYFVSNPAAGTSHYLRLGQARFGSMKL